MEAIDKFKTVEDVLKHFGTSYYGVASLFVGLPDRYIYQYIAELICKAFNDGWEPDFKYLEQTKYALLFAYDYKSDTMCYYSYGLHRRCTNTNPNLMLKSTATVHTIATNKEFLEVFKKAHGF